MSGRKPKSIDYYEALGIPRGAGDGQIKLAYRKLAMKYHPDKTSGDPELEAKFKELTAAYSVLSDPQRRKQYDMMGSTVVDMEPLDLERLNFGTTLVAALFSKLGAPIPTAIPQRTLDMARDLQSRSLVETVEWDRTYNVRMSTHDAKFFLCDVGEEEAHCGIRFYVHSAESSKFKLLLFDGETGDLTAQIDSRPEPHGRRGTYSCIHFCPFAALEIDSHYSSSTSSSAAASSSFSGEDSDCPAVFRRLETLSESRFSPLRPGRRLLAIQGDNFFQDVRFTARVSPCRPELAPRIVDCEAALRRRKEAVATLEVEYWEARERLRRAAERVAEEDAAVEVALAERDALYAAMAADEDRERAARDAARRAAEARAAAAARSRSRAAPDAPGN